ncbi:MAG: Rrf2 family transcriptional regulator, cysteine metabolism repressor [Candidatus Cloacimonadota bacterium]|nr:Rrf2 family transcriptional regulator, cysteine metabolism repressor [Candidatus Cloacimonadota bacterium]
MAVNTKTEYALRALIAIAEAGHLSAQKISESKKLPKKYIEHLLSLLKAADLINSSTGSTGGYELSKAPGEISFQDVLDAVDDKSYATACTHRFGKFCLGQDCTLSPFFSELDHRLQGIMQSYTLEDIIDLWKRE